MGRIENLRLYYEELRQDDEFEQWLFDAVKAETERLVGGRLVQKFFDGSPTALDVVFLAGYWEKEVKYALADLISDAFEEGHSWNEVAAALGVSRQAVVKRHREWIGLSPWQKARVEGQPHPERPELTL